MPQLHRLVLAGCGGMGRRHLRSYRVLGEAEPGRAELAAVVDPELERAEFVAAEAERLLGRRPAAFGSLEQAAAAVPELDVADIVAAPSAHHRLTQAAAAAGMHVLCEKPMAPTVAACRAMQRAAAQAGRVLSVAENYRRDPLSRLARALVAGGAIGELRSLLDLSGSGGNRGHAGAWRYRRAEGGPILEAGVHNADLQVTIPCSLDRGPAAAAAGSRQTCAARAMLSGAPAVTGSGSGKVRVIPSWRNAVSAAPSRTPVTAPPAAPASRSLAKLERRSSPRSTCSRISPRSRVQVPQPEPRLQKAVNGASGTLGLNPRWPRTASNSNPA